MSADSCSRVPFTLDQIFFSASRKWSAMNRSILAKTHLSFSNTSPGWSSSAPCAPVADWTAMANMAWRVYVASLPPLWRCQPSIPSSESIKARLRVCSSW